MKKFATQLVLSILLFLGIFTGLSRIPWMDIFEIKEKTSELEKQLGDFYMEIIQKTEKEISDKEALDLLEKIKEKICKANSIDPKDIKLHLIKQSDVNAFALPDNHLVIYTDLITYCKKPEELAGVMAHEIAHLQKKHVMRKLSKEIGFAALSTMLGSGSSAGAEGFRILASTAYDRSMENEADETAVKYLIKSKTDPAPMADLMFRFSTEEDGIEKHLTFIKTHPDSDKRAENILELSKESKETYETLLTEEEWTKLQGLFN